MSNLLKPEPDVTVKPGRAERVPLVADIHVEFPYAGNDNCKRCNNPLSQYNPHVLCFACVEKIRVSLTLYQDANLRRMLDARRPRNPRCRGINKSLNISLLEQAGTNPSPRRGHRPQSGHN